MPWVTKVPIWAMAYSSAATLGNKIYVVGGRVLHEVQGGMDYSYNGAVLQYDYMGTTAPVGGDYLWILSLNYLILKVDTSVRRWGMPSTTIGNKMYFGGGGSESTSGSNEFREYVPPTNSVSTKASLPSSRIWGGLTSIGTKAYYLGGLSGVGQTNFWEWDQATNTWTIKPTLPFAIYSHGCVAIGTKIYIIGGLQGTLAGAFVSDGLHEWDQVTDSWTTKSSMPTALRWMAVATIGTRIYVVGGMDSANLCTNSFWEWEQTTDTWTVLENLPVERAGMAVAIVDGRLFAFGGQQNAAETTLDWGYSPNAYSFQVGGGGGSGWATGLG